MPRLNFISKTTIIVMVIIGYMFMMMMIFDSCRVYGDDAVWAEGKIINSIGGDIIVYPDNSLLSDGENYYVIDVDCSQYPFCKSLTKQLGSQGEICKVYGHRWKGKAVEGYWDNFDSVDWGSTLYTPGNSMFQTAEIILPNNSLPANKRTCSICDKRQVEVKAHTKWVDVEGI